MRVDRQKLWKNCDFTYFTCPGATLSHEMRINRQKLWKICAFTFYLCWSNPFARNDGRSSKTEVKFRFFLCWSNPFARNEGRCAKTEVKLRFYLCWSNPFARKEGRCAKTEEKLRFYLCWSKPFARNEGRSSTESLSGFLFRPAMGNRMPFRTSTDSLEQRRTLVENLCHLVSSKGSDVLLTAGTEPLPSTHRFRTSIPRGLWHWAKICGWRWQHHTPEHINKLELKAVYTSLKWRVARQRLRNSKMLHLVDSMVSLQVLNKGRSSSHKLRRITKKCCALLIASRLFLVLAYIDTKQNPADRPSRRPTKRKWASAK